MSPAPSEDFVHLHAHTEYSMLDGAARVNELIAEAARLEMKALAITDHGNLFGAFEFWKAGTAAGVKPIIGMEGYYVPIGSRFDRAPFSFGAAVGQDVGDEGTVKGKVNYTHMTLLAENNEGLHNLFRISSLASLEGQYRKYPRFDRDLLEKHGTGIIATTGCPSGEVNRWLQVGRYDMARQAAADYRDILGEGNFFCEVMDHGIEIERRTLPDLLRLAKDLKLPLLASNDLHYTHAADAEAHEVLLCVQTGKTMADPNRFKFDARDFYLKPQHEMRALWAEHPEACDTTLLVAERCNVSFTEGRDLMPRFPVPEGHTEESWLVEEVERGLARRFPGGVPADRREQAAYELGVINQMGFPGYFLVTADLVAHAKEVGIRVGPGRGSAAGALIAYALGITELDPMAHGLLFERFLNPERISMPDIDMDFDERRRAEMIRYATARYGEERVAQIVTYSTIKAKAALKDSARVLGHPFAVGERLTKAMPPAVMGKDIPLAGIFDSDHPRYKEAGDFRALYDAEADLHEVIDTARGLEGLRRQWGVHAAGVILSAEPLLDVIPIMRREQDGAIITQFDMGACEKLGLLKMDFLGLRNLTILDDALRHIEANRGEKVVLEDLALDDVPTYELLARGDTLGVFQLDNSGMRALLTRLGPTNFEDISAVLALYRPGPMGANAHNDFADRKNGRQKVAPIHPELEAALEPILGESHGLCVTGETSIWDADRGSRVRIDSIEGQVRDGQFRTFAVGARGEVVPAQVTHWVNTGAKAVRRVTTASGHEIRLSEDHPVLTPSGWRKAGELLVGVDRLAVPKSAHHPISPPSSMTADEARILGYLVGDGYLTLYQNSLISGCPEVLADAAERIRRTFPDCYPVLRERSTEVRGDGRTKWADRLDLMASPAGFGRGRGTKGGRYDRLSLNVWLRSLGYADRTTAASKFVPDAVFEGSAEVIREFLAGLWDTDGHVGPESAFLTTISADLASGVQALLGRLGILARVRHDAPYPTLRGSSQPHRVYVYGERFWSEIVPLLTVPAKRSVSKAVTAQARTSDGINGQLMLERMSSVIAADPAIHAQTAARLRNGGRLGVSAVLNYLAQRQPLPTSTYRPPLGLDGSYLPRGTRVQAYLDQYGQDEDWFYANQHWSPIVAITDDGVEQMYDITVDAHHNFLANGLVAHNCIYQEQVMAIAQQLAGYSLGSADLLRRAMGKKKKEILDKEYVPFAAGMRANGYSEAAIKALWDVLVPFSDYAFNKAHTAGYGLVSYWTAYLKANYPAEYMAGLLTSIADDKDKSAIYLNECRRMGIKVLPPDVNESQSDFAPVGTDIRFGLSAIRNVGVNVVESIIRTRAARGRFADFGDFIAKVEIGVCNKRLVESLIKAGAFDSFGDTRKGLLAIHEQAIDAALDTKRAEAVGQFDLFAGMGGEAELVQAAPGSRLVPPPTEWDKKTLLAYEREMLGLYVSDHPLFGLEHVLATLAEMPIAALASDERVDGQMVSVAGLVTSVQRKVTKAKGEPWAIVTLEDLAGSVEVMCFPTLYATAGLLLAEDVVVVVRGRLDKGEDTPKLRAMDISVPNITEAGASGPVAIGLDVNRCTPPVVARLREVLGTHPGTVEVHIHLRNGATTTVLSIDDRLRVTPSPALYGDLKAMLGPNCLG
ncbi:MAG: DNA polymerase III subunit alpha [Candidatus Nanopelagicales bacterium]